MHCCALPDKLCLSQDMCLYQVMVMLYFLIDVANDAKLTQKSKITSYRPLAGYGLPPPRGNFIDHIFLKAQCLARILQHVSPLTMAALSCNSLLHKLPHKIFDN